MKNISTIAVFLGFIVVLLGTQLQLSAEHQNTVMLNLPIILTTGRIQEKSIQVDYSSYVPSTASSVYFILRLAKGQCGNGRYYISVSNQIDFHWSIGQNCGVLKQWVDYSQSFSLMRYSSSQATLSIIGKLTTPLQSWFELSIGGYKS